MKKPFHTVYVIAPRGGPDAYVKTLLPWLEKNGCLVSIVNIFGLSTGFPPHTMVSFAKEGNFNYYLKKLVKNFRQWPLRTRAHELQWAILKAIKEINSKKRVDLIEIIEGIPIELLSRHWPVVVRAHGSDWSFRRFCQEKGTENDQSLIKAEANSFQKAAAVSAISNHLADHLSEFCQYPRSRIEVIPYPIDTDQFSPSQESNGSSKIFQTMTVGRLEPRKGVHILLKAMPKIWKSFPNVQVVFVGKEAGFKKEEMLQMVPVSERGKIIFSDVVPHDQLPKFYRKTDIYVAPTQYETFGYTILEAMACGIPVVASNVGAVPELVEDGVNGFLVPYGDVIALAKGIISLLSDDKERRREMGQKGREKALQYRLDVVGQQMLDLYLKAIHS